jgi:gliding-associated putative ABC transporter substrate-binding component GldG
MNLDKKSQEKVIFGLTLAVLFLAAIASNIFYARLDLTVSRSFTISSVSKNLFKDIPEQVRVVYYVSNKLRKDRAEPQAIEDMLREYAASSHGKIRVDVIDPDLSGDARILSGYGIQPQQYQTVEQNEASVATVYTGILIQYLDRTEALPLVFSTDSLEYDLTRTIRKIVKNTTRVADVLIGDADKSWSKDYNLLNKALSAAGWEVRALTPGTSIDQDVNLVLVLGDSALDEFSLYPVDQFLMRGGKVFFAAKGVNVSTQYGLTAAPLSSDGALNVLKAYGVNISKELVLDASCLTVPFQVQSPYGGGASYQLVRYPHWIAITDKTVSKNSPITRKFQGLDLFWPSPIAFNPPAGVKSEILVKSSPKAWRATKQFPVGPQEEASYYLEQGQTGGQYPLAVSLEGKLPSAFAGQKAPTSKGVTSDYKDPVSASADARLVVVSGADGFSDLMQYTKSEFNTGFAVSAAEWLTSDDDILSIKNRAEVDTRLNKIENPLTKGGLILLTYFITLVLVPLGIVVFGVVRAVIRKRRAGLEYERLNPLNRLGKKE